MRNDKSRVNCRESSFPRKRVADLSLRRLVDLTARHWRNVKVHRFSTNRAADFSTRTAPPRRNTWIAVHKKATVPPSPPAHSTHQYRKGRSSALPPRRRRTESPSRDAFAMYQPRVSPSYNAGGSDSPATGSDGGFGGVSATALIMPEAEGPDGSTRAHVIEMLNQSRTRWLKNTEVCDMLLNYRSYGFALSKTAPVRPPGASAFNRVSQSFFPPLLFCARPVGDFRPPHGERDRARHGLFHPRSRSRDTVSRARVIGEARGRAKPDRRASSPRPARLI